MQLLLLAESRYLGCLRDSLQSLKPRPGIGKVRQLYPKTIHQRQV